jgi:hypothetical protein
MDSRNLMYAAVVKAQVSRFGYGVTRSAVEVQTLAPLRFSPSLKRMIDLVAERTGSRRTSWSSAPSQQGATLLAMVQDNPGTIEPIVEWPAGGRAASSFGHALGSEFLSGEEVSICSSS